jgi:hypothetical protein
MRTQTSSQRLLLLGVVAVIAAASGTAVSAFALGSESPATATVCIKPNGQLRVAAAANPICVEPEAAAEWTVNGLKEVTAGAGLIGRNSGGIVKLQVDPELNANSGKIVAGFDDGPRDVPDELALVAQLPLPAGNYAIFAKPRLRNPSETALATVRCRLTAGGDFDETYAVLERFDVESALEAEGTSALGQSMEVVHRFDGSSRALLFCTDAPLPFFPAGEAVYEGLKIIAIRGSSLSNTFIGE